MRRLLLVVGCVGILLGASAAQAAAPASATFGKTTPGSKWGCPGANYKYANPATLSQAGLVSKITVLMKGNGNPLVTQTFRAMIYADANGAPGKLVATSATQTVAGSAPVANVEFAISPGLPLAPGTYWLAQQSAGSDAGACVSEDNPGVSPNAFNVDPFSDGPSDPFGPLAPDAPQQHTYTMWATYQPASTGGGGDGKGGKGGDQQQGNQGHNDHQGGDNRGGQGNHQGGDNQGGDTQGGKGGSGQGGNGGDGQRGKRG